MRRLKPQSSPHFARAVAMLAAATAVSLPLVSSAAYDSYVGPNGGDWSTPANWDTGSVPPAGAFALVTERPFSPFVVIFDGDYSAGALQGLTVSGNPYFGVELDEATGMLVSGSETIGTVGFASFAQSGGSNTASQLYLGSQGSYSLSGGTFSASVTVVPGSTFAQSGGTFAGIPPVIQPDNIINYPGTPISVTGSATSPGSYLLSGGSITGDPTLYLGGTGSFVQSGGTANFTLLFNGYRDTDSGYDSLSSGSLTVSGNEYIGEYGAGSFLQTGGTHNSNWLILGHNMGSDGNYSLTGGTLSAQQETIGYQGTGNFTQSGGNHIVTGYLELGYMYSGVGTYTLEGGSLSAVQEWIGQTLGTAATPGGSFVQRGGANSVTGSLSIGSGGGTGSYELFDDGDPSHSTLIAANERIGMARFTQYGGTNTIAAGTNSDGSPHGLYVGTDNGLQPVPATYMLARGALQSPFEAIGYVYPGTFIQTGATNSVSGTPGSPSLVVGTYGGGTGSYVLAGGILEVAGAEVIGQYYDSDGNLTQSGGIHTISSGLFLGLNYNTLYGYSSKGGYSLAGGSLSVTGDESVGVSGSGTFVQSGGTHTISSGLSLGLNSTGAGTYSLAGGALSVAGDESIGIDGSGTFSQSGGTHVISGTVYIARNSGGHGTYSLSGGSLAAAQVSVAQSGAGIFMQAGGLASISGSAYIGGSQTAGGGPGTLAISGGTMSVSHTLKVWNTPSTSATLSGGTLSVGALDLSGDPSLLTWSNGTLNFSTKATIDSSFVLGPVITLSRGMKLSSSSLLTNNGQVALLGGELASIGPMVNGTGQITGHGTITAYNGLTNNSEIKLGGGAVAFAGQITNNAGARIDLTNATTTFNGRVTNNADGTFKISGGSVSFFGAFTNNGTYSSDPADNYFTDLQVSATGILTGGPSDRFFISGSLFNASTQNTAWNTAASLIDFHGGMLHQFSVTGIDLGADPRGYVNNFAVGTLELGSQGSLVLEPATSNAALYVEALKLDDGTPQIGSIGGNGVDIYYDPANPANAYLGGQTYALSGGGEIAPVPEPVMLPLLLIGAGVLARRTHRSHRTLA